MTAFLIACAILAVAWALTELTELLGLLLPSRVQRRRRKVRAGVRGAGGGL